MKLLSVECIWDKAKHNALTDLIYYKDAFFCCFREGMRHAGLEDGIVRIITSKDGKTWNEVASIAKEGIDLRDPKFSKMPDGKLMLIMGGAEYEEKNPVAITPYVAFSNDGLEWSPAIDTELHGEWIWQISWDKGIGYGLSYFQTDISDHKQPWILKLFKTFDGVEFSFVKQLDIADHPSEATIRFDMKGNMIALLRCKHEGLIGQSQLPYTEWNWQKTDYVLGGPNFVILPEGNMWAASRLIKKEPKKKKQELTYLYKMTDRALEPVLELPSGGDCSYPGIVYREGKLYISYYSSHEKKAKIYLAIVEL